MCKYLVASDFESIFSVGATFSRTPFFVLWLLLLLPLMLLLLQLNNFFLQVTSNFRNTVSIKFLTNLKDSQFKRIFWCQSRVSLPHSGERKDASFRGSNVLNRNYTRSLSFAETDLIGICVDWPCVAVCHASKFDWITSVYYENYVNTQKHAKTHKNTLSDGENYVSECRNIRVE